MTKSDVVSKISEQTGINRSDVSSAIEALFSVVKNSMEEGHEIYIRGFGSFKIKKRARKIGRNISKNTAVIIEEHYIPKFKPSPEFVQKIKESTQINTSGIHKTATK